MSTLAERVGYLVDGWHGGNVSSAARDLGIGQRTLAHIVDGQVTNPRVETVGLIARWYPDTTLEWLVGGYGNPPSTNDRSPRDLRTERRIALLSQSLSLPKNSPELSALLVLVRMTPESQTVVERLAEEHGAEVTRRWLSNTYDLLIREAK
jgi:hypothetical protein